MNKSVYVEFLISRTANSDTDISEFMLNLGGEFELTDVSKITDDWVKISGKIDAEYLVIVKLKNPLIASLMNVSYISNDIKNKYRK